MPRVGRKSLDGSSGSKRVCLFLDQETIEFLKTVPGPNGKKGNVSLAVRVLCKESRKMAHDFAESCKELVRM